MGLWVTLISHFKGKRYLENRGCQHVRIWYQLNCLGARSAKGLSCRTIGSIFIIFTMRICWSSVHSDTPRWGHKMQPLDPTSCHCDKDTPDSSKVPRFVNSFSLQNSYLPCKFKNIFVLAGYLREVTKYIMSVFLHSELLHTLLVCSH